MTSPNLLAYDNCWTMIPVISSLKGYGIFHPLQEMEGESFEEGWVKAQAFFQPSSFPPPLEAINQETIKWMQAWFDEGQAAFPMPRVSVGLYEAWHSLARFDKKLGKRVEALPSQASALLQFALSHYSVSPHEEILFLTLLLTTLPGWAGFVKGKQQASLRLDYLAVRMALMLLLWPEGGLTLLELHHASLEKAKHSSFFSEKKTSVYTNLLHILSFTENTSPYQGQLIFCMDPRSEPLRYTLEKKGKYKTLGCAGFFMIPLLCKKEGTSETWPSCPFGMTPAYEVSLRKKASYLFWDTISDVYHSLKNSFSTPFLLAELAAFPAAMALVIRTFFPSFSQWMKKKILSYEWLLPSLPLKDQIHHAELFLRMIGLTDSFSPWVILFGHQSSHDNNPYRSALQCGACGGHSGSLHASLMAWILNAPLVREGLEKKGLFIPPETRFIGACHDTSTDTLSYSHPFFLQEPWEKPPFWHDLCSLIPKKKPPSWSDIRPEWGLAGCFSMIIGPRWVTHSLPLKGRVFLHSYDWEIDTEGNFLSLILKGPSSVAHSIMMGYFFSTWNNSIYGSGDKLLHNITGKMGVIHGSSSDLQKGLPLQSLYEEGHSRHELLRPLTIIYAPPSLIEKALSSQERERILNGWAFLACLDPKKHEIFLMDRTGQWCHEQTYPWN